MLTVATILLAAITIGAVVGVVLHQELLRLLRFQQPDLWQALGAPERVFDDGGLAGFSAVARLYREPALQNRCSPDVLAVIKRNRAYGRAYLVFAIVLFAVVLACLGRMP